MKNIDETILFVILFLLILFSIFTFLSYPYFDEEIDFVCKYQNISMCIDKCMRYYNEDYCFNKYIKTDKIK